MKYIFIDKETKNILERLYGLGGKFLFLFYFYFFCICIWGVIYFLPGTRFGVFAIKWEFADMKLYFLDTNGWRPINRT